MPTFKPIETRGYQHAKYWFDDGSVVVTIRTLAMVTWKKAHLLARHSTYFSRVLDGPAADRVELDNHLENFVSLLEHLYHDIPLSSKTPFTRVASIPLDFPHLHTLVQDCLVAMFPSGPVPFRHPGYLEEALALTTPYKIESIRKGIYYSLVTTTDFEAEEVGGEEVANADNNLAVGQDGIVEDSKTRHTVLSSADVERCGKLMAGIVDHFTPILPQRHNMACTVVFGNKWMSLVIQSAISDGGVYKPVETLECIKQLDWAAEGLFPACVREKREEWTEEQVVV
ncbi:hypothetical protein EDC04DRAFT_2869972 [Pisolithus marmoratus]|nr:hypothetical protein EDC04DRAFT_2869972 [Pisolithus marmoratus]